MRADWSARRRRDALATIDRDRLILATMDPLPRRIYAIQLLICDDTGHVNQRDLAAALRDQGVVQGAEHLLRIAGVHTATGEAA